MDTFLLEFAGSPDGDRKGMYSKILKRMVMEIKKAISHTRAAGWKGLLLLCLAAFFFGSFFVSCHIRKAYADRTLENTFGRGETDYKRISVFFSPKSEVDREQMIMLRNELTRQLGSSSSVDTEHMETVFIDAYEAKVQIPLSYQHTFLQVDASFVGGHYFDFHTMTFLRGGAFHEDDSMHDGAVISESLAFALFGSKDCVGKTVWIEEKGIRICGVVEDRKGYDSRMANPETQKIYLPYVLTGQLEEQPEIIAYELLLPETLDGFALKNVDELFSVNRYDREASLREKEIYIVEETDRFRMLPLLKAAAGLQERMIKTVPVAFPDWENERIIAENRMLLVYLIRFGIVVLFLFCIPGSENMAERRTRSR